MDELNISEFSFRVLLLFLPGIICSFFVDRFTVHRPIEPIIFIIRALVFGFASYFLYWLVIEFADFVLIHSFGSSPLPEVHFLKNLGNKDVPISYWEILFACGTSVFLAILITIESTYKIGHNICIRIGITRKFGELDVWGYALSSTEIHWVTVRDLREDLIYDGWVSAHSDDGKDAELLLMDVSIFRNSTAEHLYDVASLYVSRDRGTITLEFRKVEFSDEKSILKTVKPTKKSSNEPRSKKPPDGVA